MSACSSSRPPPLISLSRHFSSTVSSVESRKTFVNNILKVFHDFNLDGIDIDWEYPGRDGAPGNQISPNDSDNFLLFLNLLRAELPPSARISAAVESTPFIDSHGNAMKDVSRFAQVLDWVLIMNYDVWECELSPNSTCVILIVFDLQLRPNLDLTRHFKIFARIRLNLKRVL